MNVVLIILGWLVVVGLVGGGRVLRAPQRLRRPSLRSPRLRHQEGLWEGSERFQEAFQRLQDRLQETSGRLQEASGRLQVASQRLQEACRRSLEASRKLWEASGRPPGGSWRLN